MSESKSGPDVGAAIDKVAATALRIKRERDTLLRILRNIDGCLESTRLPHALQVIPGRGPKFWEALLESRAYVELLPATPRPMCETCFDRGWYGTVKDKIPCDGCDLGPVWLNLQVRQ